MQCWAADFDAPTVWHLVGSRMDVEDVINVMKAEVGNPQVQQKGHFAGQSGSAASKHIKTT